MSIKPKVLIVDDSPSDRRIYRRFIEKSELKVQIFEAGSEKSAFECLEKEKIDCIVLDYRLRDSDGIEFLTRFRKSSPVPVILITGQPDPLTQTQAYVLGAMTYMSKDLLSSTSLTEAIRDALKTA